MNKEGLPAGHQFISLDQIESIMGFVCDEITANIGEDYPLPISLIIGATDNLVRASYMGVEMDSIEPFGSEILDTMIGLGMVSPHAVIINESTRTYFTTSN